MKIACRSARLRALRRLPHAKSAKDAKVGGNDDVLRTDRHQTPIRIMQGLTAPVRTSLGNTDLGQ